MFLPEPTLFTFLPLNSLVYGLLVIELNTQFKSGKMIIQTARAGVINLLSGKKTIKDG
jgi:hypothetical protein